jgi:predicted methyltransferase
LLAARRAGAATASASPDLGLSMVAVALTSDGVVFPSGQRLTWRDVAEIDEDDAGCFALQEDGTVKKIHIFSTALNRPYSLMPTSGAPTIINSGFTMHRIVGIDPYEDTRHKIRAIAPVRGTVLDTTTGLGYTAIEAAKTADHVVTIELDPAVLDLARYNPWSRALFDNPRIEQRIGDSYEVVPTLAAESFTRIIHDPPSFSLAGELYSGAHYVQLYRVLRRGGRLFHYIGNLESTHGHKVATGAMRRLREAGFARVVRAPEAFGLVAYK